MTAWLRCPSAGRDLGFLTLAVGLIWLLTGGHHALGSSVRYAQACLEMAHSGQWLIPTLYTVPYMEKPPLTYWLGAVPVAVAGFSWHAVHLASALSALVSLIATWGIARSVIGDRHALLAASVLGGSAMFLVFITELTTDPVLSACLAVCWLAYLRHDAAPTSRWIWLFWCALGLGIMTKGVVAVGLASTAIAGFHLLVDGPLGVFRALWRMRPLRGLLILLALNAPWNLAIWQRDPRLIEYFWVRYNLGSFLGSSGGADINHRGPLWLYPMTIVVAFVPLTVPVLAALGWQGMAAWHHRRDPAQRARVFLVCALVFPLLLLSASSSKLETYIMPLFPCIALLAVDAWTRCAVRGWWRYLLPVQALTMIVAAVVALALAPTLVPISVVPEPWHPLLISAVLLLITGQSIGGWWWWHGRFLHGAAAAVAGLVCAACLVLPALDQLVNNLHPSALAQQVANVRGPHDLVVIYHDQVHEYDVVRELGRLPIVAGAREVGMGHFVEVVPPPTAIPADTYFLSGDSFATATGTSQRNPWLMTIEEVATAANSDRQVWLFADTLFANVLNDKVHTKLVLAGRCGRLLLISNRPPPWPMPDGGVIPPFILKMPIP